MSAEAEASAFAAAVRVRVRPVVALAVLMLRGPQTLGEVRGRSQRLGEFTDLEHVEQTLRVREDRENGAFVRI